MAWAIVAAVRAAPPPPGALPLAFDFTIDRWVLLFALLLSCATGVLFGIAPAFGASRPVLVPALKGAGGTGDERGGRFDLKKILVVAEVALSLLLLITAGLFVRSLQSVRAIDPGIDVERLASAPLNINLLRYTRVQGREFYRQVVERAERLPGVESASVARIALLGGQGRVLSVHVEGRGSTHDQTSSEGNRTVSGDLTLINANVVGPRFFKTIGIPLLNGRDFRDEDAENRPLVVILNATAANMHFPGANPDRDAHQPRRTAGTMARDRRRGARLQVRRPVRGVGAGRLCAARAEPRDRHDAVRARLGAARIGRRGGAT